MIKLTQLDNKPTFVNVSLMRSMTEEEGNTYIIMSDDNCFEVKETPEQIIHAWEEYQLSFVAKQRFFIG